MANIDVSNSSPFNGSRTHSVTATDVSDGSVTLTFPTSYNLVSNVQVLDARRGIVATTGMLIDNSVAGVVNIGTAPAVEEVLTLTIGGTAIATTGTANIVLNGAAAVDIVTTNLDTAVQVATNIAAGTYTGWTTSRTGLVITFTATAAGAKAGANTFGLTTSTGITGTFATVTEGVATGAFALAAGQILNVFVERDNAQFI
jgi:hypothetical protein